jgi:hypothetical protein
MDANDLVSQITIETPCLMDWDRMEGDDRVRYCASCNKHIYDLTAMTTEEAVSLIRTHQGELCGRLYRRPDGTFTTTDCGYDPALGGRPRQFHLRTIMAIIAGIAATLGLAKGWVQANARSPRVPGPRTMLVPGRIVPRGGWQTITGPASPPVKCFLVSDPNTAQPGSPR